MKKALSVVMLFCLIALTVKPQGFDTVVVRNANNNTVSIILRPKTEKIISTLRFSGTNSGIFSDEEIRRLEKGKEVVKKSPGKNLPVSLLPLVRKKQLWINKVYKKGEDGTVGQIKPDIKIFGPEGKISFSLSLFWVYMPILCILLLSLVSIEIDKDGKKMILFTVCTVLAIALAVAAGWFVGKIAGEDAGWGIGAMLGAFAGYFAGYFSGRLAGAFAGTLAGAITGAFAGVLSGAFAGNSFLKSSEFQIIRQYVCLYLLVCFLAVGLRELFVSARNRNDKKTAVA